MESRQSPLIRPRAPGLSYQCSHADTHQPSQSSYTYCNYTYCNYTYCNYMYCNCMYCSCMYCNCMYCSCMYCTAARWCATVVFSTTCAVHMKDCDGWWLSGCLSSVVEHLWLQPGALGSISSDCQLFTSHQLSLHPFPAETKCLHDLSLSAAGAQVRGQKEARICECG